MSKIIIAGSRTIANMRYLILALKASKLKIHGDSAIVCGMARGADELGYRFAQKHGLQILEFPADWDRHGKSAGYIRNVEMAKAADACVVLWDGVSKGSLHMEKIARQRGLQTYLYLCKNNRVEALCGR